MYNHKTIRTYTAAILDFFKNTQIEYETAEETVFKTIPLVFATREKAVSLQDADFEDLNVGNYNFLPKGSVVFNGLTKNDVQATNKNKKISLFKTDTTFEYSFNSVPYVFDFELVYLCRGMNEACQIIENIAPKFNPTVPLSVWDAENLNTSSDIPLSLEDISISHDDYDEFSFNLVSVAFRLSIAGNLYSPINKLPRVKEFKIFLDRVRTQYESTKLEMMDFDVGPDGKPVFKGIVKEFTADKDVY